MPIIKLDDYCRKCNKLIGVQWAKSKCPLCGVLSPVEPVGFIQETINLIYVIGVSLGFLFLFGLIILIGIIFIFFMKSI